MYFNPFYIVKNKGNNAFSYEKRQNKKLFVTNLKKINSYDEIKLGSKIVFEDFDENGVLESCKGLENFYEIDIKIKNGKIKNPSTTFYKKKKVNYKKLYLFDNHNHAYFFWHKAKFDGIIGNNSVLIHIDQHSDLRDPGNYLQKNDLSNLEKIFEYTNQILNVGNYIIPAKKDGIIGEIIQIRSENDIKNNITLFKNLENKSIILNLDLDFFEPNLEYIRYDLKKELILELTKKASLITVATSPFFINQNLALKIFKDLFDN